MQVSVCDNLVRLNFGYNPQLFKRIKKIPGSEYNNEGLYKFWTIPTKSLIYAKDIITPGNLYPDAISQINPNQFKTLKIEIKTDRIKAEGLNQEINNLFDSIKALCSYEEKNNDDVYEIKTLAEKIYYKNNIMVITFPKGLYSRVKGFLSLFSLKQFLVHQYEKPEKKYDWEVVNVVPRSYQKGAVNKIERDQIPNRATLVMATGAGKTLLAAFITARLGVRTIFYTYSLDLLNQTIKVFERVLGQKIGIISGKKFDVQPITVASIQTVYRCMEKQNGRWAQLQEALAQTNLCFIDEGHMLGAKTVFAVAKATDAYYSYALTATPDREDGKEIFIEAGTGPTVELIPESELLEGGFILPVEVQIYKVPHKPFKFNHISRFHRLYEKEMIEHWDRNRLVARVVRKYSDKQIIVLIQDIIHGKRLCEVLNCPFISGKDKDKEREKIITKFKNKEINVIVASSILKQGIDLPEAEVLILAHGGTSLVNLQQKVGRVRRPDPANPQKIKGIVIDFWDYTVPKTDNDIFKQQSEKRLNFYKSKNYMINWQEEKESLI